LFVPIDPKLVFSPLAEPVVLPEVPVDAESVEEPPDVPLAPVPLPVRLVEQAAKLAAARRANDRFFKVFIGFCY
jgi:hypothetical protein